MRKPVRQSLASRCITRATKNFQSCGIGNDFPTVKLDTIYTSLSAFVNMETGQSFPVENSSVDIRSSELEEARSKWAGILEDFQERLKEVSSEGSIASCSRHQNRGQLLRARSPVFQPISMITKLMLLPILSQRSHRLTARLRLAVSRAMSFRWTQIT